MGAVACDDGQDGDGKGRYQAVYVQREGQEQSAAGPDTVQRILWDIDQVFEASAKRYAGYDESRRPRFVQNDECAPEVMSVQVSGLGEEHSMSEVRDLAQQAVDAEVGGTDEEREEWNSTHRKLFFYDTGKPDGCGTASMPNPETRADMHSGWAEVSWGCTGEGAMTHEMTHQFGVSHCDEDKAQGNAPICRGYDESPRCDGPRSGSVLDCGLDDFAYFHPRPAEGSYLAAHPKENVARSPYLMRDRQAKPVAARLADQESGKCVAAEGSSLALDECGGDAQTWVRAIGGRDYFKLKLGDQCLARGEDGTAGLARCVAGERSQHWWMTANEGESKDGYRIEHRSGGDPVEVDGAATFVLKPA